MTTPEPAVLAGHELLLRLAGRIPDQVLADARRRLAAGEISAAVTLVADLLGEYPVPLTAGELTAIRDLAGAPGALPGARPVAAPPALPFEFSRADRYGEVRRDELDEAVAAAAEAHSTGLVGLWRSWRYPLLEDPAEDDDAAGDGAWSDARAKPGGSLALDPGDPYRVHRVYIAQVEDPGMVQPLAAGLLAAVAGQGRPPGVEVIVPGAEPPAYQRAALAESMLVWATVAEPEFELAAVFDFADPVTGPGFAPGHAVIDDPGERDRLLGYLRGGATVLTTTAGMNDVLDPAVGAVVPTNFRTDGVWIWTDTVEYYLSRHGIAPDARLTAHIDAMCARGELVPDADQETAVRAADFLLHPPAEEAGTAVWFPGD